jgi:putative tricarboxylic transport membrane protein
MGYFIQGFASLCNPMSILLIAGGTLLGIVFGALPGLNTAMAVCLCLPLTFVLDSVNGIAMIMGIFIGGVSGGLISAILLNIPGTAAAMSTCFDGHPMAMNGKASRALGIGIFYSVMGTIIGMFALILISRPMANGARHFSSVEYFASSVFSLTRMASFPASRSSGR